MKDQRRLEASALVVLAAGIAIVACSAQAAVIGHPLALAVAPGWLALAAPPAPTVVGPRDTTSTRPVYGFRARRAASFRCAFDSTLLHRCARRYSEPLTPGAHVLRVRAVGRDGKQSRVTAVRVNVRLAVPGLALGVVVDAGPGAGVPAVGAGSVWVPATSNGTLARVDPASSAVTARLPVGPASARAGDLDAAVFGGDAVWSTSDAGGTVARVDPSANRVTARITVASRPGGLAAGGTSVWAFHFLQPMVTGIDVASNSVQAFTVPGLLGTGIAYGDGSLWLLSVRPSRVFRVDPASGTVLQTISLRIPFAPQRSVVETWWLAYGDGAVWATLPNHRGVARVDAATGDVRYVRIPYGDPFGVAVGEGSAWVATDRAVWKLDGATGRPQAASLIPRAGGSGFVSIAYADGGAWLTNYDRGTLVRVTR